VQERVRAVFDLASLGVTIRAVRAVDQKPTLGRICPILPLQRDVDLAREIVFPNVRLAIFRE